MPRLRHVAALAVLCATATLAAGCAPSALAAPVPSSTRATPSASGTPAAAPSTAAPSTVVAGYPFGAGSFWRSSLSGAPVASDSRAMVDYLVASITDRYNGVAAFNAHSFDSHLYTATASTPTTDFVFNDCQKKGFTPTGLVGTGGQFDDVPVPAGAVPATGSDAELSVYSPATDQLWEFWKASRAANGTWSACWGGRLDDVSTSAGYFTGGFGATATGLPNAGGLVRLSEITAGSIGHAISIAIPNPAVSSDFSWPAQRSDGLDADPAALPEGTRLRLDPKLDLSTLHLTRAGLIIATAAQRYGFVIVDRAGSVAVLAEAVDKVNGSDPWYAALKGPDYGVLQNFPWSSIQVIQKDYGKPAS